MSPERWLKIEAIFQTAIDLPHGEREAFLTKECGGDNALRLEIDKLLASDESANNFIESPIWTDSNFLNTKAKQEISDSLDKQFDAENQDNYIGKKIGAYRLTREIGRGGMGAVYLAERDDGEFYQKVAIKLIKRGMDSDFIVRRFRHERQILASFEHPFIARLLDGGSTSESVPYFVMEYIEGDSLYNYCDQKHLGIRDRLKLFQKVCSAIEYAHERQIIHRDIKPSNILINRSGSPKLLDFGIAKILDPDLVHESINPTASMLRMMTPDYASPEQVQGIEVTPSSDIYSLGILLYELLTGHRPYNFAGRALHEVSRVICEMMPELPSRIISNSDFLLPKYIDSPGRFLDVRVTNQKQLSLELARDLDDIIMKAISKDPADRYASVKDFSRDLTRHLTGARVEAPHFNRQQRREPDPFLKIPENSKALAVLPLKFMNLGASDKSDDQFLGLGLADALITRLSKVRRFVVRPTSSVISFGDELIDPIRAGRDLNVDYILDGNIKKANNRLRVTVQLLNVAENAAVWAASIDETLSDFLTLEDTLANKVIEVLLPQLTGSELADFGKRGTEIPEAFEHYLRGRYHFSNFTEEGFAKAFVSFHSAIAADPDYANAYAGIADYYNWLGIVGVLPPQDCFLPAIEAASRALELDENLSEAHASLGFSLHAGNYDWERAGQHLRRAIELNPSNANAYVWYSIVLFTEGKFNEGLEYARRAAELDPLAPFNHHNIGWGLYFARRYDEAVEQYRRVIAEFPTYGFGYYGLSKIHRIQGETGIAITENAKAKEMMDNSVLTLLSEAECFAANGQPNIAREKIANLSEMSEQRYVSPYQLALVYCYLRDGETVLKLLEEALDVKEAWLNWIGIEPAFDIVRNDPRFQAILKKIGYAKFFLRSDSVTGQIIEDTVNTEDPAAGPRPAELHDLTTLVIAGGAKTDEVAGESTDVFGARKVFVGAAVLLFLAIAAGGYFLWNRNAAAPPAAHTLVPAALHDQSIVILPFRSSDPSGQSLGIGLADALSNKLGYITSVEVLSASTGRAVAGDDDAVVAKEIGVSYILRGDLKKTPDGAQLSAKMISTSAGEILWEETFSAHDGDLFGLQTKLAEKIWTSLGIQPRPLERLQVEKSHTLSAAAYELYLIGRYQMTSRTAADLRKAIATFSASLKEDPDFAPAYVGLADAYALLNLYDIEPPANAYELAEQYISRALEIDDNLADAHATRAYVRFYSRRDREGAELDFRRAIQVNPSYAQAHHWFALVLVAMNRQVEAQSEAQIAQRLDPLSLAVKSATGMSYFFDGQMPETIAECDKALAIDPGFVPALKVKRWAYAAAGDYDAARAVFEKELNHSGGSVEDPGWKIIAMQIVPNGDRNPEHLSQLRKAVSSPIVANNPFAFAYEVALAFNNLGDREKALAFLERAEAAHSHGFNFLEVDPRLSNLHREPRFQRLLRKLKVQSN